MRLLSRLEDKDLVARVLGGRRDDFAVLAERYGSLLEAIAFSHTGNHADAEDVVQSSFLKAFTSLHTLRDPRQFGPWISTIARNEARQYQRKAASTRARHECAPFEETANETPPEDLDMRDLLRKSVMALEETPREVLLMHYFAGKSTREIAHVLGVTPDAVKKRLERARATLSERLTDELGEILGPKKKESDRVKQVMAGIAGLSVPWLAADAAATSGIGGVLGGLVAMSTNKIIGVVVVAGLAVGVFLFLQIGDGRSPEPMPEGASTNPLVTVELNVPTTPDESAATSTGLSEEATPGPDMAATQGIVGRVRDKDSLAGIEGVEIELKAAGKKDGEKIAVLTDATGAYKLTDLPAGDYEISRGDTPPPYREPTFADTPVAITVVDGATHRVNFAVAKEAPFSGVVIDSVGQPVPDAKVHLAGGTDIYIGTRTTTDEAGRFRFRGLSPTGELFVIARKDELVSEPTEFELSPSGRDDMVVVIETGAYIEGKVVDVNGRPLPEIRVIPQRDPSSRVGASDSAFTNANGEFSAGPVAAGKYRMVMRPKEEMPNIGMHEGELVKVATGERLTGLVLVYDRNGTISGTVRDQTGQPIAGAQVSAASAENAKTDADGRYTLSNLSPKLYTVNVHAAGYVQSSMHGVSVGTERADFVLESSQYTVSGRVVDAQTGAPVPQFEVAWFTADPLKTVGTDPMLSAGNLWQWESIENANGEFSLGIDWYVNWTSEAVVAARATGFGTAMALVDLKQLVPGGILLELEGGGRLMGTVSDESGAPVKDAMVFFERSLPGFTDRAAAVSDANGQFSIDSFPQTAQRLAFYHPDYATVYETIPADWDMSRPLAVQLSGGATIEGTIHSQSDLDSWTINATLPGEFVPVASTEAASGAPFTLRHVMPGEVTVGAYVRGENFRTIGVSRNVSLAVGQTLNLDLEAPSGDASLAGQIDLGGQMPGKLRITVRFDLGDGEMTHMALARSDGSYEIQGLPSGAASLEVEARMQDGQLYKETQAVSFEPGQATQADFVISD